MPGLATLLPGVAALGLRRSGKTRGARARQERSGRIQRLAVVTREVMSKSFVPKPALGLDPREGMARRKAQSMWCPRFLLGNAAGASRRASTRSLKCATALRAAWRIELRSSRPEADSARKNRACSFGGDLANTGPRFRLDIALKARGRPSFARRSEL